MKKIFLTAVVAGAATMAAAQQADPSIDVNGDGFYSYPELGVVAPDMSVDAFGAMDTTGDGLLDMAEVAAAQAAGSFPAIQ